MIFNKTTELAEIIASLEHQKENNIFLAEIVNDFVDNGGAKQFNKESKSMILEYMKEYYISNDEDKVIINQVNINKLNYEEFASNAYANRFKDININNKDLEIASLEYKPYEIFISDEINIDEKNFFEESVNLGYFEKSYKYLSLSENNTIWMLITPNEILTMKKHIEMAKGNVLTFGLGLGYFQYMTHLKKDVEKIYVIEKNQKIIELFNKYFLPKFDFKNKIVIIEDDAFSYSKYLNSLRIHYLFLDIYHNPLDGLNSFLEFKKVEKNYPSITFSYWLNTSFFALIRRCMISILIEQYFEGYTEEEYLKENSDIDKLINYLYFKTKDLLVDASNILELLNDENLNRLLI